MNGRPIYPNVPNAPMQTPPEAEPPMVYPHVCFTANLACSGVSPCADCKGVVRDFVIVPFMQACGFRGTAEQATYLLGDLWEGLWRQLHEKMDRDPALAGKFRILPIDGIEEAIGEANRLAAMAAPSTADVPPAPPAVSAENAAAPEVHQGVPVTMPGMLPMQPGVDLAGVIKPEVLGSIMNPANFRVKAHPPPGSVDGKKAIAEEKERLRNLTAPTAKPAAQAVAHMTPAEIAAAATTEPGAGE